MIKLLKVLLAYLMIAFTIIGFILVIVMPIVLIANFGLYGVLASCILYYYLFAPKKD